MLPLEAVAAWWLYHCAGRGGRRLGDPRSAMSFVLLVPGAIALFWGLLHLGFASVIETPTLGPGGLPPALGLVLAGPRAGPARRGPPAPRPPDALAPPPRLAPARDGARRPRPDRPGHRPPRAVRRLLRPSRRTGAGSGLGDWLEIGLLALATSAACVLLSRLHGPGELLGWQLWGGPGLLIVWAGIRQGLRGGTLVASAAAVVLLLARRLGLLPSADPLFQPLLQGHLAAQCSAALLISAGAAWLRRRDADYRQVVSQVAVVIYSARLLKMPRGSDPPRGTETGVSPGSDPAAPGGRAAQGDRSGRRRDHAGQQRQQQTARRPRGRTCSAITRAGWRASTPRTARSLLAALEQLARQEQPGRLRIPPRASAGAASSRGSPPAPGGEVVPPRPRRAGCATRSPRAATATAGSSAGRASSPTSPSNAPSPTTSAGRRTCSTP